MASHAHPGAHDFDFFFGSWRIANARLKAPLTGSDEWEHFDAWQDCEPILGGLGNLDRFHAVRNGKDFAGSSLRLFHPPTGQWRIYWMDNVSCELQPPVTGAFIAGVGDFYGNEQYQGKPIVVRYRWSDITADAARWEQAFSEDGGETWETNWIMTCRRKRPA